MTDERAVVGGHMRMLCVKINDRSTGSSGNIAAALYIKRSLERSGWNAVQRKIRAMDWHSNGAKLICGKRSFEVFPSQYSLGCSVQGELLAVSTVQELERADTKGKIILLYGDIAAEQLMPKNFVFYNPESSRRILACLEKSGAKAIICATGRNASLAGGAYPFPLIEDGDFNVASVYLTDIEGQKLKKCDGKPVGLVSRAFRKRVKTYSILGIKKGASGKKIVISAHMDAKKGSPGALDNATGVAMLLVIAQLLGRSRFKHTVELAAFNGEDYYGVPGQMDYIRMNANKFGDIILNINIDGAAYKTGGTAVSFYGVPAAMKKEILGIIGKDSGFSEGPQWPQGDHSIFVQQGVPAIAVTSEWFSGNINSQKITHTKKDHLGIVSNAKIISAAKVLSSIIARIAGEVK